MPQAQDRTVVNWVVEYRNSPGRPWGTLDAPEGETDALRRFAVWQVSARKTGMQLRLVRRTAVITDEIVTEYLPSGEDDG